MISETRRKLNIIQHTLQLPTRERTPEVVVVGSAGVGLRPANDVDLLVTRSLFDSLKLKFSEDEKAHFPRIPIVVFDGEKPITVEAFTPVGPFGGKYIPKREIFNSASRCEYGCFPVAGLDAIGSLKEGMGPEFGREKDLEDVESIRRYLKSLK